MELMHLQDNQNIKLEFFVHISLNCVEFYSFFLPTKGQFSVVYGHTVALKYLFRETFMYKQLF